MSKCGEVIQEGGVTVCEHTYICIHTYAYIYIYTYTYSTPNNPAPLNKILYNTVFLSITPTFVYLLEKGQHAL